MSSIQFGPLVYTTIYNYFSNFSYWTNRQIPPTGKAILTQATMAAVSCVYSTEINQPMTISNHIEKRKRKKEGFQA
jgi:hypothetical protein